MLIYHLCIYSVYVLTLEGEGWIIETGLVPIHLYACPKPRSGFSTYYIVFFVVFSELKWLFVLLVSMALLTNTA